MQIIDIQNHIPFQKKIGIMNQPAEPLRKGDVLEIYQKYYDPTVVGDSIYVGRVLTSTNLEIISTALNSIHLIPSVQIDIVSNN